ncbi:2-C-methyl-D-erythritol 4-phosphate cytidylyltransferase [Verrucomicrobia bacterium]|jgi:2-C-methyl-D-erythritol 4-phosphate cytidylyltransferase|nr:2-C-methyl-D-erythritol 4-phosphate cytidylyltransferase [Verrucomicrobiota bacterium]
MHSAVIVAAGKGTRMGGETDKLFLMACGLPIIAHTWRSFDQSPTIQEIVVVIREERESEFRAVADLIGATSPFRFEWGGAERQDSVWNGIMATDPDTELVAVHDGARPCVSEQIIADCFEVASRVGASVAASRVADTLKSATSDQTIDANVDRSRLWAVQTPQVFKREIILNAMKHVRDRGLHVTDDTAACEKVGQPVALVESKSPNPKVTVPADLPFIEWLLSQST